MWSSHPGPARSMILQLAEKRLALGDSRPDFLKDSFSYAIFRDVFKDLKVTAELASFCMGY